MQEFPGHRAGQEGSWLGITQLPAKFTASCHPHGHERMHQNRGTACCAALKPSSVIPTTRSPVTFFLTYLCVRECLSVFLSVHHTPATPVEASDPWNGIKCGPRDMSTGNQTLLHFLRSCCSLFLQTGRLG